MVVREEDHDWKDPVVWTETNDPPRCYARLLALLGVDSFEDATVRIEHLSAIDRKLRKVIGQLRRASNEATTSDAAVTYTECADAVEAAIAVKLLVAVCEGCGMEIPMPTNDRRKVSPSLPAGWSQCGVSLHRVPGRSARPRLAAWCPSCRAKRNLDRPRNRQCRPADNDA